MCLANLFILSLFDYCDAPYEPSLFIFQRELCQFKNYATFAFKFNFDLRRIQDIQVPNAKNSFIKTRPAFLFVIFKLHQMKAFLYFSYLSQCNTQEWRVGYSTLQTSRECIFSISNKGWNIFNNVEIYRLFKISLVNIKLLSSSTLSYVVRNRLVHCTLLSIF